MPDVVADVIAERALDPQQVQALVCGPEIMMQLTAERLIEFGVEPDAVQLTVERNMQCGTGLCGHCQMGGIIACRDGPVVRYPRRHPTPHGRGALTWNTTPSPPSTGPITIAPPSPCGSSPRATAASSACSTARTSLLAVAGRVDIAYFPEATTAMVDGPYDVSLVEGSITTEHDVERIHEIRRQSRLVVTLGACATAGGIQALRNGRDVAGFTSIVYAHPEYISTLDTSTPIADHVHVDLELRGCPIDRGQLLQTLAALLNRHVLRLPTTSVCTECKARSTACVMVAHGTPCLGPVTMAGCGALCPGFDRGCYGCFGPMESPNLPSLRRQLATLGVDDDRFERLLHTFNTTAFTAVDTGPPREESSAS